MEATGPSKFMSRIAFTVNQKIYFIEVATRVTVPAGSEASIALPAVAPAAADNSFEKIGVQVLSGGTTVLEDGIFATVVAP